MNIDERIAEIRIRQHIEQVERLRAENAALRAENERLRKVEAAAKFMKDSGNTFRSMVTANVSGAELDALFAALSTPEPTT